MPATGRCNRLPRDRAPSLLRLRGRSGDNALVELYRGARDEEHPDWNEYREAMVEQQRLVLTIDIERVYGAA